MFLILVNKFKRLHNLIIHKITDFFENKSDNPIEKYIDFTSKKHFEAFHSENPHGNSNREWGFTLALLDRR